jgi:hypothetical protein
MSNFYKKIVGILSAVCIAATPSFAFATTATVVLTTGAGSNQTWVVPSNWDATGVNTIDCIGAGGSGASQARTSTPVVADTGGGGGSFAEIKNFMTHAGTSITYQIGLGGGAITTSGAQSVAGTAGGDTWFNAAASPGAGTDNSKCAAKGGGAGVSSGTLTVAGGAGGTGTSGWGQTLRNGGTAGTNTTACCAATGGGGAGGNNAVGANGTTAASATATAGGAGGGTSAAGGGAAATSGTTSTGGTSGTEYGGSNGSGGGGGGLRSSSNATITAGSGGQWGAGGGGCIDLSTGGSSVCKSGAGKNGVIAITYTQVDTTTLGRKMELFNGFRLKIFPGGKLKILPKL